MKVFFVFFNMKMVHQSAAAAAALCMVVLVLCSSGATSARVLREGEIPARILEGGARDFGDLPGNVTEVVGSSGLSTQSTALPPCAAHCRPA